MAQKFRTLVGFSKQSVQQLVATAGAVIQGMTGNKAFPSPSPAETEVHSFTCRRNRDNASIAVDFHRRVQCSGAAANTLEKLLRAGTLHEKRLKQLRIVWLASASYRLSFTRDR